MFNLKEYAFGIKEMDKIVLGFLFSLNDKDFYSIDLDQKSKINEQIKRCLKIEAYT